MITTVLETFRASSHQQPSAIFCDRRITNCRLGLIVGNTMRSPRHLATHPRPTSPLIDRITQLVFGVSAYARCRPPVSCIAGTMFVDSRRLDLAKLNMPHETVPTQHSPAQPGHARLSQHLPGDHCSRHTRGYGGSRTSTPINGPKRKKQESTRESPSHIFAMLMANGPL